MPQTIVFVVNDTTRDLQDSFDNLSSTVNFEEEPKQKLLNKIEEAIMLSYLLVKKESDSSSMQSEQIMQ